MSDLIIKYLVNCPICGKDFYAKRKHANTCSPRCRFILYQLNIGLKNFEDLYKFDIVKLNDVQLKESSEFVRNNKMLDKYGNAFELIDSYIDPNGDIIRSIFRNGALKYLEIWNRVDWEIEATILKFK